MRSSSPSSRRGSAETHELVDERPPELGGTPGRGLRGVCHQAPSTARTRPITPAFAHAEPTSTRSAISARTSVSLTGRAPASRRAGSRRDPPAGSGATASGIPASRRSRRSEATARLRRRPSRTRPRGMPCRKPTRTRPVTTTASGAAERRGGRAARANDRRVDLRQERADHGAAERERCQCPDGDRDRDHGDLPGKPRRGRRRRDQRQAHPAAPAGRKGRPRSGPPAAARSPRSARSGRGSRSRARREGAASSRRRAARPAGTPKTTSVTIAATQVAARSAAEVPKKPLIRVLGTGLLAARTSARAPRAWPSTATATSMPSSTGSGRGSIGSVRRSRLPRASVSRYAAPSRGVPMTAWSEPAPTYG